MSGDVSINEVPEPIRHIVDLATRQLSNMRSAANLGGYDLVPEACAMIELLTQLVVHAECEIGRLRDRVRDLELTNDRRDDYEMEQRERNL